MLTAVVIAKNEAAIISDCLASLDFADQKILIDNGSLDPTPEIASKKYRFTVIYSDLIGWDKLHNLGLQKSQGDWILYLDADERISDPLKQDIKKIVSKPFSAYSAYEIVRHNIYLGKPMKYGGWGNDSVIRLFKKNQLFGYVGNLHEQPKFKGKLGKLASPIIHYSHRDLHSMTEKTILFTNFEANNRLKINHPIIVPWRIFRVMLTEFWLRFVKLSAWKDGVEGVIDGLFQVYNSGIIYCRLWELQHA